MRCTLLGHASLLIQAGDTHVLMDPVFFDPFEGAMVSCPRREVHVDRLPRPDAIVVSHAHWDHFDPRSLSQVPRETPIFCANHRGLALAIAQLGFESVEVVKSFEPHRIGDLELVPTLSRYDDELGIIFRHGGVSLWNQVDTIVTQDTCVDVLTFLGGSLDAAIVSYNPLLEYAETWVSEDAFPQDRYERLLEMALATHARLIVPGSSGQRFEGPDEWLNPRVFPVSTARFLEDLRAVAPEQAAVALVPGEALRLEAGGFDVEATEFASVLEGDTAAITFSPEASPVPPLTDPNRRRYSPVEIRARLEETVGRLNEAMRLALSPTLRGPLRHLWDRRSSLMLEFVTPGETLYWTLARWAPAARWEAGRHPEPDYAFSFLGSEILEVLDGEDPQDKLCYCRRRIGPNRASPFRLGALDPARLFDVDLYLTIDEEYNWHPLNLLADLWPPLSWEQSDARPVFPRC